MKITFLSTLDNYWGGSEVLWVATAKQMIKDGHNVQVAIYKRAEYHPAMAELLKDANSVHYIYSMKEVGQSSLLKRLQFLLYRRIKPNFNIEGILKFKADILFVNQPATYEGIFYPDINLLFKRSSSKLMLLTHGNFDHVVLNLNQFKEAREIFRRAKRLFFVSENSRQLTEHQLVLQLNQCCIIDNPLNLIDISYIPYPDKSEVIQFASVARLDATCKGQDLLFKVLSSNKWKKRNWQLNLYGEGEDLQYLNALAEFYEINNRIVFHGQVKDIRNIWKDNHILIMPSFAEGKPISLAEAMICGRPAIVTNVAGNSELVIHEQTGYLIEAPTSNLIDQTLEFAWDNREEWEKIGINARDYALTHYDLAPIETLSKLILENA